MPNFIEPLEQVALLKSLQLRRFFDAVQQPEETVVHRLFCEHQHWHPLPTHDKQTREAFAVDGGLRTFELVNGSTLIVAQALLLGSNLDAPVVDVEILRGNIPQKTVDRFADLFRQKLEVSLAAAHISDLPPCGIMYLDGALYGGLPQLYPMDEDGIDDPTARLIEDYHRLFNGCTSNRTVISIAKSSRAAILSQVLQEGAGQSDPLRMSDSEMIYRWTDQKAGFSTPVLLGTLSFRGWPSEKLLEPDGAVTQMPAILSFHVRLDDFGPALRVDVPCTGLGIHERIVDLTARLMDPKLVEPVVATLLADYGGPRVYNSLLYAVDSQVAIHQSRFVEVYLPILESVLGIELAPTLSAARFID